MKTRHVLLQLKNPQWRDVINVLPLKAEIGRLLLNAIAYVEMGTTVRAYQLPNWAHVVLSHLSCVKEETSSKEKKRLYISVWSWHLWGVKKTLLTVGNQLFFFHEQLFWVQKVLRERERERVREEPSNNTVHILLYMS